MEFTPRHNLYRWQPTDEKLSTINESANNADKLDTVLSNVEDTANTASQNATEALTKATTAETNATEAKETADTVKGQFDQVVAYAGEANPEVVQARGGEVNLNARLDKVNAELAENATYSIRAMDYGAKTDGSDCSASFDSMLNDISNKRVKSIVLENGTYRISKPFIIPSGIELIGNDTIIQPHETWINRAKTFESLIELVGVEKVKIKGITFDLRQDDLYQGDYYPYSALLVLASKFVSVDKCKFINIGTPVGNASLPSRSAITLISQDVQGDWSELPTEYLNTIGSCEFNTVNDCEFINDLCQTAFGIRVVSTWTSGRLADNFINFTQQNKISHCNFEGNFLWNHIEIAGPATKYNLVDSCQSKGMSINNFDIDKGASFNRFTNLVVKNSGMPTRFLNDSDKIFGAIAIHGIEGYVAQGNVLEYSKIIDITNPDTDSKDVYASGILVDYASDTVVRYNQLKNILNRKGVAIMLGKNLSNIRVENNKISGVNHGIFTNQSGNLTMENVILENNNILNFDGIGIQIAIANGYFCTDFKLINNTIFKDSDDINSSLIVVSGAKNFYIGNNILTKSIKSGDILSITNCDLSSIIEKNQLKTGSVGIRTNNTEEVKLLFNTVLDCFNQLIVTSSTVTPYKLANSFV